MQDPTRTEVVTALAENLAVTSQVEGDRVTLTVALKSGRDCVLHWGLSRRSGAWERPPEACWPAGTTPADGQAVRTPFAANGRGECAVTIHLDRPYLWKQLSFVLYYPTENRWVKNGRDDFTVPLPPGRTGAVAPADALNKWAPADAMRRTVGLDGGEQVAVAVWTSPEAVRVRLASDAEPPLVLHWGVAPRFRHEWVLPPEDARPAGTSVEQQAARTPFTERDGLQYLELNFPTRAGATPPRGMRFVLYQPEGGAWLKSGGKDVYLPLVERSADPRLPSAKLQDIAEQIIGAEMGAGSWTLMHRFNLCHDLLEGVQDDEDGLALLFAWLRYSAIRQLDWQRRYNTQPRELSHAQDRLTKRLAVLWKRHHDRGEAGTGCRLWARLLLTTLGRGGEGQRVRDEILHIMHRNHLKEVAGTFVEEWHQKLHNNTTPDDVVICAAYLEFLRSNGAVGRFYHALEAGGVTRERLRGFERPIRTDPVFYGDRKDALIHDFEHFLAILKSVHSGIDLDTAAHTARGRLDGRTQGALDGLYSLRHRRAGVREIAGAVLATREGVKAALAASGDDAALRDLLFLDLALEGALRAAIERENLGQLDRDTLADLTHLTLRGVSLSSGAPEVGICAGHWGALLAVPRTGRDWALHAKSVADRAGRWVAGFTDDVHRRLQPKAEYLGTAFEAAAWTIPLFSEEVIRGGPAFALSLVLRRLDPVLRKEAGLGGWQIISPAAAAGRVRVADHLHAVQGEHFPEATVLVADAVAGNEEIPEGVTAVITADTPDLVSHIAVRARNAQVLFATCFDREIYERLKGMKDSAVTLRATPGGDVEYQRGNGTAQPRASIAAPLAPLPRRPVGAAAQWVIGQDQFTPAVVGGKANNLNGLRGRLPDWIRLPTSLALPFGAFDRALADENNRELRRQYDALVAAAGQDPGEVLTRVRELVLQMAAPAGLQEAVLGAWGPAGLPSVPWEQAWDAIRRVWASKWTERAYLSRQARGVPHENLVMAVLIQQVVPADYAFVIHTVNPLTGNRAEIYAEVVLGLGETLVGNYPGRALGFVCRKADLRPELLSYPGKSVGLYGKGVIFRSDSNGEDLEGFAGAGLYESVLAEEPEHRRLDYRGEKLVWDTGFRDELLRAVARIGIEVEKTLGSPQDIEGAVAGGKYYVVQTRPQVGLGA